MKGKSSNTVSIVIVVLFLVGIFFVVKHSFKAKEATEVTPPVEVKETPPKLVDLSLATVKTYNTPDQYASFDVKYPEFKDASDDFNQKIASTVIDAISAHKKDSADNWQARYETRSPGDKISEFPATSEKYTLSISWKATQVNKNYISFLLAIEGYNGGAHGYENILSFNYNVAKQKEVSLSDLFPNDSNYLKTISDYVRKDLTSQFRKRLNIKTAEDEKSFKESVLPMLEIGTTPDEINFSVFTFTSDKVILTFVPYQVAAYAMGTSTVTITRK